MKKKFAWILASALIVTTFSVASFAQNSKVIEETQTRFGLKHNKSVKMVDKTLTEEQKEELKSKFTFNKEDRIARELNIDHDLVKDLMSNLDLRVNKDIMLERANNFLQEKINQGIMNEDQAQAILKRLENCPNPNEGVGARFNLEEKKELVKEKITKALAEGKITQEQADEILQSIENKQFRGRIGLSKTKGMMRQFKFSPSDKNL